MATKSPPLTDDEIVLVIGRYMPAEYGLKPKQLYELATVVKTHATSVTAQDARRVLARRETNLTPWDRLSYGIQRSYRRLAAALIVAAGDKQIAGRL